MGEVGLFEPFMLVSSYRTVAASPTGMISQPDTMVLSVDKKMGKLVSISELS